ncbi:MAG TPA: hypothetical protein VGM36_09965 [Rhizomicrobium sp.]
MKRLGILTAAIFLSGCVGAPYVFQNHFDSADFEPWNGSGSATLSGQAFLKTVGGDVKTCAGAEVDLLPATAYNEEVVSAVRHAQLNMPTRSSGPDAFMRKATCDAQGNFTFENLPALKWIVWTTVRWGVPRQYSVDEQGGNLIKEIVLQSGPNRIILADPDLTFG